MKIKSLKTCSDEILLSLAINAKITDGNFHYTECGMAKLLQESCKYISW